MEPQKVNTVRVTQAGRWPLTYRIDIKLEDDHIVMHLVNATKEQCQKWGIEVARKRKKETNGRKTA